MVGEAFRAKRERVVLLSFCYILTKKEENFFTKQQNKDLLYFYYRIVFCYRQLTHEYSTSRFVTGKDKYTEMLSLKLLKWNPIILEFLSKC